jgi:MOSC domain-containing protein YiiM
MDLSFRHDFWLRRLPSSPKTLGRVERIVVRPRKGERTEPESVEVSPERGVHGDRWESDPHRRPGNQVSLMNVHVLHALIDGDARRFAPAGDNLVVDLDLSEANLPVGSLLTIDAVVLEVTPDPHRPCASFLERYGALAAKRVARGNRIGLRTRGVLACVVVGGTIRIGSAVHARRPGAACLA